MAAARDRRCKQQGRCAAADALWGVLWCAVWLWFAARTLGTARRILACQQFGTACRRALYAGAEGNWGTVVVLEDAAGRLWRLCGVADPDVKAGDTVTAGQKLGTVGTVGCECAEESHIHVEVKQGEAYLDPAKLPE